MKIAVINEFSTSNRNADIISALEASGAEILNVGMTGPEFLPSLNYLQTGIMTGIMLNTGAADFVVGGCGTGQGYINSAMQFPNVFCGLIAEPLDAWLFSQINGGNCISLPLNKGYGWAAEHNLKYIFEKLFQDPMGQGYPLARAELQTNLRNTLKRMSVASHRGFIEILQAVDKDLLAPLNGCTSFLTALQERATDQRLASEVVALIGSAK